MKKKYAIALIIFVILFFIFGYKFMKPTYKTTKASDSQKGNESTKSSGQKPKGVNSNSDIGNALRQVKAVYGGSIARNVEKIYRLETANFKSRQFLKTASAGMEKHSDSYPYGWSTPAKMWNNNPNLKPVGFVTMPENQTGISKTFLKFPSVKAGMFALASYLVKYKPERWYSTNRENQERYKAMLDKINTKFV